MNKLLTIVVAGGSGRRMGGETPKQFLEVGGEPILMRSLRRLSEGVERFLTTCSPSVDESVDNSKESTSYPHPALPGESPNVNNFVHKIVLVLPEAHRQRWQELCRKHRFRVPHTVATGGETRFHSVRNGLAVEPEADLVLVHDGVRPFVDDRTIAAVIAAAWRYGAAVPAVPVVDSLRRVDPEGDTRTPRSEAVDRSAYRAVQTPHGFRGEWLRRAYAAPYDERFTDDASVVERTGTGRILLTEGTPTNLKITTPVDLILAEALLRQPAGNPMPAHNNPNRDKNLK